MIPRVELAQLVAVSIAVFGASWIVSSSKISRPMREALPQLADRLLHPRSAAGRPACFPTRSPSRLIAVWALEWMQQLLACPACVAFHLGAWPVFAITSSPLLALMAGAYASGVVFVIGRATGLISSPR